MKFINQKENGNTRQIGTYEIDGDQFIILTENILSLAEKYKLSKTEMLVYALVDNICTNTEQHMFYGTGNYVASRVHCNIPHALKSLKSLESKQLIIRINKKIVHGIPNKYTIPKYKEFKTEVMPWEKDI